MTERQAWPIDEFGPPDENGDRRIRLRGGTVLNVPAAELATAGITPPPDPVDYPDGMVIRECDSTAVYPCMTHFLSSDPGSPDSWHRRA
jgi:hypothetical protein